METQGIVSFNGRVLTYKTIVLHAHTSMVKAAKALKCTEIVNFINCLVFFEFDRSTKKIFYINISDID